MSNSQTNNILSFNEWNDLKTSQSRGTHKSIFEDKGSIDKVWFEMYCGVFLIVLSVLSLPG